nr:hypothetical protein [Sunxiuqinia sp.]
MNFIGTGTRPKLSPAVPDWKAGIEMSVVAGQNIAKATNNIPAKEVKPNIFLLETVLPMAAPVKRPTNISNQ